MKTCDNVITFGSGEKLWIRSTFYLSVLIGMYGLWPAGPGPALGYLAFVAVSYGLLMRYSVCARCPHLFVAGDCLFMPASLARKLVSPRSGGLKVWEAGVALAAAVGTVAIPVYRLAAEPLLLALFLGLSLGYVIGLAGHVCRKCQVEVCPCNRNPAFK
jgi:hypothetical protein